MHCSVNHIDAYMACKHEKRTITMYHLLLVNTPHEIQAALLLFRELWLCRVHDRSEIHPSQICENGGPDTWRIMWLM